MIPSEAEIMRDWGDSDVPLVSIKCLVYNHENYVSQALDGFLIQKTNFLFEVVIHDDASTDNSAKIIKEYEEKYPRIIKPIYESENQYSIVLISESDFLLKFFCFICLRYWLE